MRRLAVLVLTLAGPATAADDTEPVPVEVHATRAGVGATLDVRYRFPIAAQYGPVLDFELPAGAIVTGATATIGGTSHALALVPRDDDTLQQLGHAAITSDPGWALAIDGHDGHITITVAFPRASELDLRLAMHVPTCFDHDVRYVALPPTWPHAKHAESCAGAVSIALPSDEAASRPSGERFAITAGGLDSAHLARVELDLASTLADVPADLATAIVIDHSRSLDPGQQSAIEEVVRAYLAAAPAGRVQAIAFARTATPLLSAWTPARDAGPAIARALGALPMHNGSNLDVALAEAASWLSRVPGTHRVIVLTDALLASRIHEEHLTAGDALIHVVDVDGRSKLHRDDGAPLAKVALATGGIAVRAGHEIDATMLVRPISLDHVAIDAPGWSPILRSTCSGDLVQGDACTWWGRGRGAIAIAGDLWGTRVTRVVTPDPSRGRDIARELAANPELDDDIDADLVQREAYGVDRAWSLVAKWGGSGGYEEGMGGIGITGSSCCGGDRGGILDAAVGTYGAIETNVDATLAHAIAGCNLADARVELTLELTRSEIVDVEARIVPRDGPTITSGALHTCIVDRVWDTDLAIAAAPERSTKRLVVVGA